MFVSEAPTSIKEKKRSKFNGLCSGSLMRMTWQTHDGTTILRPAHKHPWCHNTTLRYVLAQKLGVTCICDLKLQFKIFAMFMICHD